MYCRTYMFFTWVAGNELEWCNMIIIVTNKWEIIRGECCRHTRVVTTHNLAPDSSRLLWFQTSEGMHGFSISHRGSLLRRHLKQFHSKINKFIKEQLTRSMNVMSSYVKFVSNEVIFYCPSAVWWGYWGIMNLYNFTEKTKYW